MLPSRSALVAAARSYGAVVLLLLSACTPADPALGQYVGDEVAHNDFEAVRGWGSADTTSLTTTHAHSGRFAVVVDARREKGFAYDAALHNASVHPLRAVEVEAWVNLPSARADAALSLQLWPANGSPPTHYDQLRLLDQVTQFNQWVPVHALFKLPAGLGDDDRLRIFLWRSASAEPVYLDDIRVKARE